MKAPDRILKLLPKRLMALDRTDLFEDKEIKNKETEKHSDIDMFFAGSSAPEKRKKNFLDFTFHKNFKGALGKGMNSFNEESKLKWLEENFSKKEYRNLLHEYYLWENSKKKIYPVDDAVGEIRDVVIGYTTHYVRDGEDDAMIKAFDEIYKEILEGIISLSEKQLPRMNFYTIVRDGDAKEQLENWFCEKRKNYCEGLECFLKGKTFGYNILEKNSHDKLWIQDEIVPVVSWDEKKKNHILYSRPEISTSALICHSDDEKFDARYVLPETLVGGNILFVGPYLLVGYNSLYRPSENSFYTAEEFKQVLSDLFAVKKENIIIIGSEKEMIDVDNKGEESFSWFFEGNNHQPLYHLDLFITPAGINPDTGKFRLVIGEPVLDFELDSESKLVKSGYWDWIVTQMKKTVARLEEMKEFEIERIPMPLTYVDLINNVGALKRVWVFASYNNCIVQYIGNGNRNDFVLLPRYSGDFKDEKVEYMDDEGQSFKDPDGNKYKGGDWSDLEKYEKEVEEFWSSKGIKPLFISNFLPLLIFRGALRCMVKIIDRGTFVERKNKPI